MYIKYLLTKKKVRIIFLVIALLVECCEFRSKSNSGRGSSSRGSSSRGSNFKVGNSGKNSNRNPLGLRNLFKNNYYTNSYYNSKRNRNYNYGYSNFAKGNSFGSIARSNTFKNAIVGAAAGYLTYQAGKAIIKNINSPMLWNNRQYYWSAHSVNTEYCSMLMTSDDPQFGSVFFPNNTRPKTIIWKCSLYEYCCGYECCPQSSGFNYSGSKRWLIVIILLFCGVGFIIYNVCQLKRNSIRNCYNKNNFMPNRNEPPPQYTI